MNQFRLTFTIALAFAGGALAQDAAGIKAANLKGADVKLMQNHDPEVERANFDLLPGYEVNLFASEPMLANPIHMVWDSRGRLWVACSWSYPQLKPGEVANDKIIILEDTNGDGAADKSTVFAEGLYMPTGIELANGGCYVAQTPDVFFLKDTDGDDVADVKELALTGFGIEDSHHSVSAWRRGPGGWLYFQEGIFLHSQIETQHGMVRNYNGGVYQYNPRTQQLRMFARIGVGNPWGHVFDRWGQSFFIDNPRVNYLSPSTGNSGEKVALAKLIQTEKQCGGDLASGTHLPEEIRGQLLTGRFKSRTVVRYEFLEDGAGFSANVLPPLIASRHPNFRPVDVKVGPDGAVYVADWYNSIINHAQHDFRDPRRDHEHGRIWRITAKDRPLVQTPRLVDASIPELLEQLKSPEGWVRHQARLQLSERDRDEVAKGLEGWVAKLSAKDPDHDHHLVEAMWACQNVERSSEAILQRVLAAKDGHARAAGARVIRYWHGDLSDPVGMIAKAAGDPVPRVRMEAILSAGFVPKAEAFPAALLALDHPRDKFIEIALPQTVKALESYWRPALEAGTLEFTKAEHREYAMREAGINFDKRLAAFFRKRECSTEERESIRRQLVAEGTVKHVKMVVDAFQRNPRPRYPGGYETKWALLEALEEMGRRGTLDATKHISRLQKILGSGGLKRDVPVIQVLAAWKIKEAAPGMLAGIQSESWGSQAIAMARALGEIGEPKTILAMKDLAQSAERVALRFLAVLGLIGADLEAAAPLAAQLFALERKARRFDPSDPDFSPDPLVILEEFTKRAKGAAGLASALEGVKIHESVKTQIADYHRRTGLLPSNLLKHFESAPSSLSAALLHERRKMLVDDVATLGDPARGEMVYRRKELACMSCHAIGSVGPEIGPNLVAVGAAGTTDYIVEAILQPNKSIAEHYDNMMITLKDGGLRVGVITYRSEQEIVVRDSAQAGKEMRISREKIMKMEPMPSLMPAGLMDQLKSRQEFLDLANFVSQLGRPGPYANDESPVIRKWNSEAPLYSTVSGELPMQDLTFTDEEGPQMARAYANVAVQVGGGVLFKINDTKGLALAWIEERTPGETVGEWQLVEELSAPVDLKAGRYLLQFLIVGDERGDTGLRVELVPAPGSGARVVLNGRD